MKVALVATRNRVVEGDTLRLEWQNGRWIAYNGATRVGIVAGSIYGAVEDSSLIRYGDMVYVTAFCRMGIAMLCNVIPPTAFSLSDIKESTLSHWSY